MAGLEILFLTVLGAAVGSFLMVVVDRYEVAESIITGRSHCDTCKKTLRWWEMIPLLGWFIVQGKCPRCHAPIRRLYPLFEAITALSFGFIGLAQPDPYNYWWVFAELVLVSLLLILFFYDWLTLTFPTFILYSTLGFSILFMIARVMTGNEIGTVLINDPYMSWLTTPTHAYMGGLWGVGVGAGSLALLAVPSKGKWMGYGDIYIGAILGAWVGYPFVIVALAVAFYSGALVAGIQLLQRRISADHRLAFGPFLIFGGLVARVYGEPILRTVLRLWGVAL